MHHRANPWNPIFTPSSLLRSTYDIHPHQLLPLIIIIKSTLPIAFLVYIGPEGALSIVSDVGQENVSADPVRTIFKSPVKGLSGYPAMNFPPEMTKR